MRRRLFAFALAAIALLVTSCGGSPKVATVSVKLGGLAGTWAAGATLPAEGSGEVPAIFSCGSSNFCVALDQQGAAAWVYKSGSWKFHRTGGPAGGPGTITGLQCFAGQTCTATDAEADVITYKDGKWASKSGPTTNGGGPMGCASTTLCLFVDGVGQSYTWDGKAFSKPEVAYPSLANTMGSGASNIACASSSVFCVVADELGYLGTYSGGRWGGLSRPFNMSLPLGAGCTSPTECISPFHPSGGPAGGEWAVWDGRQWATTAGGAHGFPDADAQIGSTMSCAAGLCMGLDNQHRSGLVGYAYNGRSWSETGPFGEGAKPPSFVSCATATWCMAIYVPSQGTSVDLSWVFHSAAD